MSVETFHQRLADLTQKIADKPLNQDLAAWLNTERGPDTEEFSTLRAACEAGVREGWLCDRSHGGIKFGRIFKPDADLARFSVDVVEMDDIKGPHHSHPNGEIDMIMPIDEQAKFDGQGEGWMVYERGSAHFPTVTGGKALILYLLPEGRIEFTKPS